MAKYIRINGIVQGVGFRPFVARLARELGLCGWVKNTPEGVEIYAEMPKVCAGAAWREAALDEFCERLQNEAPAAAKIISFTNKDVAEKEKELLLERGDSQETRLSGASAPANAANAFKILPSKHDGARQTLISPDLSICPDCLQELFDPKNKRFHYPFINCTNCGPRFTIINDLPYDRCSTSMHEFEICEACATEYNNEENRRYHAQPNACFECGPALWLISSDELMDAEKASKEETETNITEAPMQVKDPVQGFDKHQLQVRLKLAKDRKSSDELIEKCAKAIQAGKIAAVKGLGGWHLVCDARNENAVHELRKRKNRPSKPLAIMLRDAEAVQQFCIVSDKEKELLETSARPIVLLRRCEENNVQSNYARDLATPHMLAPSLVGELPEVGVMLPTTPVQYLLLEAVGNIPLVMTSANKSGEPILADDEEALTALQHIADVFLGNNRAITTRYDDSVVRLQSHTLKNAGQDAQENMQENARCEKTQLVRRARGYAPVPLLLNGAANNSTEHAPTIFAGGSQQPNIFAAGSQQKATFAFLVPQNAEQNFEQAFPAKAFISQHLGDLEHAGAWNVWLETKQRYEQLFALNAQVIACDMHPEYISSKWARGFAEEHDLPLIEVQHHHAHIASVMGENSLFEQVIGVALDGTGYGCDGKIWGCEVLIAGRSQFERFWHLPYFCLPSAAGAIYNPERCAYGLLNSYSNFYEAADVGADAGAVAETNADNTAHKQVKDYSNWLFQVFSKENPQWQKFIENLDNKEVLDQMIKRQLNCPECSSLGRLFDAAAALLGITAEKIGYDGEPACLLEAAALKELDDYLNIGAGVSANMPPATCENGHVESEYVQSGRAQGEHTQSRHAHGEHVQSGHTQGDAFLQENTLLQNASVLPALREILHRNPQDILPLNQPLTALNLHVYIAKMIIAVCESAREKTGLNKVCLSGGCMVNRLLHALIYDSLMQLNFEVFENVDLPPNDACISFGQAIVAQSHIGQNCCPKSQI